MAPGVLMEARAHLTMEFQGVALDTIGIGAGGLARSELAAQALLGWQIEDDGHVRDQSAGGRGVENLHQVLPHFARVSLVGKG